MAGERRCLKSSTSPGKKPSKLFLKITSLKPPNPRHLASVLNEIGKGGLSLEVAAYLISLLQRALTI